MPRALLPLCRVATIAQLHSGNVLLNEQLAMVLMLAVLVLAVWMLIVLVLAVLTVTVPMLPCRCRYAGGAQSRAAASGIKLVAKAKGSSQAAKHLSNWQSSSG